MKITTITATYGGKLNLGNYNQVHIELSLTAELTSADNEQASIDALFDLVRTNVQQQARPYRERLSAIVRETFAEDHDG